MNTWNTLLESFQQRVYNNTLATVKRQIQKAENPTAAEVIITEAARVDNAILLDNLSSEVALEEPEIGGNDPNIPMDSNRTDDELHLGMPGGCRDYNEQGDEIDESDGIHFASGRRWATSELERFNLGTSDVDRYEGNDGDNADEDKGEEASQADDGSTQNLENRGHSTRDWRNSTRECEDWTVYFRPVKFNNCEANAPASDVSDTITGL